MSLESVLAFVRRWWWLFAVAGFLAAGTSYVVSTRLPKVYESHTKLELLPGDASGGTDYSQIQGLTALGRAYTELVKTQPVLDKAITKGNLGLTYDQAAKLVSVSQVPNTQVLQIAARANTPDQAATLATLVSDAFVQYVRDLQDARYGETDQSLRDELQQVNADLAQRQAELDGLRAQPASPQRDSDIARVQFAVTQLQLTYQNTARSYSDFRLTRARAQDQFTVVEPAAPNPDPVEPRVLTSVALAALVGLLIALGAASLAERLDDRLFSAERLARQTGLHVLGTITKLPGHAATQHLPMLSNPAPEAPEANMAAEAFRLVLANVRFLGVDAPVRTLLVTSGDAREGKTTTAANLAIAAAQAGDSVLLIDTDLRCPSLHQMFRVGNAKGLTSLLVEPTRSAESMVQDTNVAGLRLLSSGPVPPNPGQLLGSRQMSARLAELATLADLVIFDSPPLLAVSDATHLAAQVDGVLLVVDAKRTRNRRGAEALNLLRSVRARVLGAVLNRQDPDEATFYGYYGEREGDGQPSSPEPRATALPAVAVDGRTAASLQPGEPV